APVGQPPPWQCTPPAWGIAQTSLLQHAGAQATSFVQGWHVPLTQPVSRPQQSHVDEHDAPAALQQIESPLQNGSNSHVSPAQQLLSHTSRAAAQTGGGGGGDGGDGGEGGVAGGVAGGVGGGNFFFLCFFFFLALLSPIPSRPTAVRKAVVRAPMPA